MDKDPIKPLQELANAIAKHTQFVLEMCPSCGNYYGIQALWSCLARYNRSGYGSGKWAVMTAQA